MPSGEQLERALQRVCEDVLQVSPISWSDDLLDFGAESLSILKWSLALQQFSGRNDLSLDALF